MNTKQELKQALEKIIKIHNTMTNPNSFILEKDMCARRDFDNLNTYDYRNNTYKIALYCNTYSSCASVYYKEVFTYNNKEISFQNILKFYESILENENENKLY